MRRPARPTNAEPESAPSWSARSSPRADATKALFELASAYGIVPARHAPDGSLRVASPEVILDVLRTLGAPLQDLGDVEDALWEIKQRRALAILEPVTVVSSDGARAVRPQLLRAEHGLRLECFLESETGETREWMEEAAEVALPRELEEGYYSLTVTVGSRRAGTTRILLAPDEAHDPDRRTWGVSMPLHALRTRRGWGTGDFGDLGRLVEWSAELGGGAVDTLPLFASFLSTPFEPSPYLPASRLFWNELYLDVEQAPELDDAPQARALLDDPAVLTELRALRREPLVDHARAYRLKRRVLEALASAFFAGPAWRSDDFWRFLHLHDDAGSYAGFRAACEREDRPFRAWPQRQRDGALHEGDYSEDAANFHLYCQWLASRQLGTLADTARERQVDLCLELPVGVHPDGYDVWRYPDAFAADVRAGIPPDDRFPAGRDWGFPPLHPERIRDQGYGYVIACVRNACRHAGTLRLDQAAALHRLYWIPPGGSPEDGVYVRYAPEEMWAILCIESRRWRVSVVGEDHASEAPEAREAILRHAGRRTYVAPLELREDPVPRLEPIPPLSAASVDAHDTPPFAAWWRDAGEQTRAALLTALGREVTEAGVTAPGARGALTAALEVLAASDARLVLVNLEDLWLEDEPQAPEWRRKSRFALETFRDLPEVVAALREVDRLRRREEAD